MNNERSLLAISEQARRYFGYFDSPEQATPVYDPGPDAPCPFCHALLAGQDVRTISIMFAQPRPGDALARTLSLFYRVHRTCQEAAPQSERDAVEHRLLDLVE